MRFSGVMYVSPSFSTVAYYKEGHKVSYTECNFKFTQTFPNDSPHGRSLEIPRAGGEDPKAKILEANYEAKVGFPGGRGVQNKKFSMGGVWIFSGTVQWMKINAFKKICNTITFSYERKTVAVTLAMRGST